MIYVAILESACAVMIIVSIIVAIWRDRRR